VLSSRRYKAAQHKSARKLNNIGLLTARTRTPKEKMTARKFLW
jgi:hypothetical protein